MRTPLVIAAVAMTALLAACGADDANDAADASDDVDTVDPAAGACLAGSPDCQDMGPTRDDAEQAARSWLGQTRDELPADVRIARVGDEQFALTDDYVIDRITVELDPDAAGTARVVRVTIELADGPLTVTS